MQTLPSRTDLADGIAAALVSGPIDEIGLAHGPETSEIAAETVWSAPVLGTGVIVSTQERGVNVVVLGTTEINRTAMSPVIGIEAATEPVIEIEIVTGTRVGTEIRTVTEIEIVNGHASARDERELSHHHVHLLPASETRKTWKSGRWRKSESEKRKPKPTSPHKRTQGPRVSPSRASVTDQLAATNQPRNDRESTLTAMSPEPVTTAKDEGARLVPGTVIAVATATVTGTETETETETVLEIEIVIATGTVTIEYGIEIEIGTATVTATEMIEDAGTGPCLHDVTDVTEAAAGVGAVAAAGGAAVKTR